MTLLPSSFSSTNTRTTRRICTGTSFQKLALVSLLTTLSSSAAFQPANSTPAFIGSNHRNRTLTRTFTANTNTFKMSATAKPQPPITRRDEEHTVIAGVLPADHPLKSKLIRQSETSTEALLDPPRHIPDAYGWLRDEKRTNTEVLDHLKAENTYTEQITAHLGGLRTKLYDEMIDSIQETDYTTPGNKEGKYYYYTRSNEGESYRMYCRAPVESKSASAPQPKIEWDGTKEAPILPGEECYLNVNALAKDKSYCSVSSVSMSKSQSKMAYAVDYTGDEIYSLVVKNLDTNEVILEDPTLECYGSVVWGGDEAENIVYYLKLDDAQRPFQVWRKYLDGSAEDEMLFEQLDDLFWTGIGKSSDERYLFISTSSSETSEVHYIDLKADAADTETEMKCVAKRRTKVLYDVEHWDGHWIITSNVEETPNMRLMTCKVGEDESQWKDMTMVNDKGEEEKLFDGGYERSLDHVEAFEKYLVASGRFGGIPRVWVMNLGGQGDGLLDVTKSTQLSFDEDAYDVGVNVNYNYDTDRLVLYYDSMTTPPQSLEVSMLDPNNTAERTVIKEKNVPGYVKGQYDCERTTVTSRDGKTDIPVSIVYRRDVMEKHVSTGETVPVHLIGYGSYGACSEADFSATRLTLLNRGMVYVVAHIRGGGEMGRQWYEEPNGAKYLCKKNTFNDFCDIARWLNEEKKMTTPEQLSIEGRSAGGLLIGASINQAPELFGAAILGVPFVDVVCTMTDSSIPLTCGEWEEWGNPNEEKYFDYMMEYSPMNTVKAGAKYPSCLLTGGLHDPRVQFWEPSKFAAELRHSMDNDASGPVCLKIDMTAGHFSASDRYKYLKELSFDYAFLLDQLGLSEVEPTK